MIHNGATPVFAIARLDKYFYPFKIILIHWENVKEWNYSPIFLENFETFQNVTAGTTIYSKIYLIQN